MIWELVLVFLAVSCKSIVPNEGSAMEDILGQQLLRKKSPIFRPSSDSRVPWSEKILPVKLQLFLASEKPYSTKRKHKNKITVSIERSYHPEMDNLQLLLQTDRTSFEDLLGQMLVQENSAPDNDTPGALIHSRPFHHDKRKKKHDSRPKLPHTRQPVYLLRAAQPRLDQDYVSDNFQSSYNPYYHPGFHPDEVAASLTLSDVICVSSCENEEDIARVVYRKTGEIEFCEGSGYSSVADIQILNRVTSQRCSDSILFAILKNTDSLADEQVNWNLKNTDGKELSYPSSWTILENAQYKLAELDLGTLPDDLVPGEYHVTTSRGGQGGLRVFTVVCYDNVHPVSRSVDIQVLCEARGALDGDVTFTWEIPTETGDAITVSVNKPASGYKVEEYLMETSPISVLSIPPSAQRVSRLTLLSHVTTSCGCRVTGEVSLVIWDLEPHHNVTKQGQEGYLALTILGSDHTWPSDVLEVSRNSDGRLVTEEMLGYRIRQQQVGESGELTVLFTIPGVETRGIGRQSFTISVSYKGEARATALHLHVVQVEESRDAAIQLKEEDLTATLSLTVRGALILPSSIIWEHETDMNSYTTESSLLRTSLVLSGIREEQQTTISLSYSLAVLGSDAPLLHDTAHFLLTVYRCHVVFPEMLVCPSAAPTCYSTTVYQRGACTCSYQQRGMCKEPTLHSVTCPATSEWRLTEWSTLPCQYSECGKTVFTTRTRDCKCRDIVDNARCGDAELTQGVECRAREYQWTEWSVRECPRGKCYDSVVRRYRLCHCLGDVDFAKCQGDVIQNMSCKADKMCFLD